MRTETNDAVFLSPSTTVSFSIDAGNLPTLPYLPRRRPSSSNFLIHCFRHTDIGLQIVLRVRNDARAFSVINIPPARSYAHLRKSLSICEFAVHPKLRLFKNNTFGRVEYDFIVQSFWIKFFNWM